MGWRAFWEVELKGFSMWEWARGKMEDNFRSEKVNTEGRRLVSHPFSSFSSHEQSHFHLTMLGFTMQTEILKPQHESTPLSLFTTGSQFWFGVNRILFSVLLLCPPPLNGVPPPVAHTFLTGLRIPWALHFHPKGQSHMLLAGLKLRRSWWRPPLTTQEGTCCEQALPFHREALQTLLIPSFS